MPLAVQSPVGSLTSNLVTSTLLQLVELQNQKHIILVESGRMHRISTTAVPALPVAHS